MRPKTPPPPRGIEEEYSEILVFMVEQIAQRFRVGVLETLNKKTVSKFEDAQKGNFATITLKLAREVQRKIRKQFNHKRIMENISRRIFKKADGYNSKILYGEIEQAIGISTKQMIAKEAMGQRFNTLVIENALWVQKLQDETLEKMINDTIFAMNNGQSLEEITAQFDDIVEERKGHAKFLAHNQIQNYNSLTTKARAEKLGYTRAVWDTSGDESVRPSHADRDGKEFNLNEGCYSSVDGKYLLPGVDYNCRCTYRLLPPDDEDVEDTLQ